MDASDWYILGRQGGGDVAGTLYDAKECYTKSLELDPTDAGVWKALGKVGGGAYDSKGCYVKALELDADCEAWTNLGVLGGGWVQDALYDNKACYVKALELYPTASDAWKALGNAGGGMVQLVPNKGSEGQGAARGVVYSAAECAAVATLHGLYALQGKDGVPVKTDTLTGKYVFLYFAAEWCPDARDFTPVLAELVNKNEFVVVYVSSDQDQKSFDEFYGGMPSSWLAVPFQERNLKDKLCQTFEVKNPDGPKKISSIPKLILLGPDGTLKTTGARGLLTADKKGGSLPWE